MYIVVRQYSDANDLFDILAQNEQSVRDIIGSVPGLVSYSLVRTDTGGFSVTACEDKEGTDESLRRASAWIAENAPGVTGATPTITEGEAMVTLTGEAAPA